ncbi:MAG: hypothetical protein ACXQT1_06190 [Methermicoccaceae archaeon]
MKRGGLILAVALLLLVLAGTAVADMNKMTMKAQNKQPMHVQQWNGNTTPPMFNMTWNGNATPSWLNATHPMFNMTNQSLAERGMPVIANSYRRMLVARGLLSNVQNEHMDILAAYHMLAAENNTGQPLEVIRSYFLSRADRMLSETELMKAHVNVWGAQCTLSSDRLDEYSSWMEQKRQLLQSAQDEDELRALNQEMVEKWQGMSLEMGLCAQELAAHRIDDMTSGAHNASALFEHKVQQLEAEGNNTSQLALRLSRYNTELEQATVHKERAEEQLRLHAGFDEQGSVVDMDKARRTVATIRAELGMATREMMQASHQLKDAFGKLKPHRHGILNVAENDTLHAEGDGKAVFSGAGELTVAGTGLLTVKDGSGDASVSVEGNGTKSVLPDGTVQYAGLAGTASINGTSLTASISGSNIVLDLAGTGSVLLIGNGTYTLTGAENATTASWHMPPPPREHMRSMERK